jgi:hypothetical protein
LEKVSKLVKWLDVLAAQDSRGGRGEKAWKKTVAGVKDVVQQAVARRGLAPLSI